MKLCTRMKFDGKILVPIGLIIATAGCTSAAALDETSSTLHVEQAGCDTAAAPTEQARDAHGPAALIGEALSKTELNDEQRAAVERLGNNVREQENAVAEARRALGLKLAHQLRTGRFDACAECELGDEIDAIVKAREEASPVLRKAFEDLHGILEPWQRAAFVDALKARMQERMEAMKMMRDALAKDLRLSDEQKMQIHEVLAKAKEEHAEERAMMHAALGAFKGDTFSMEAVAPVANVGERTRERAMMMFARAKEISAILTPEQREILANKIEGKLASAECERVGDVQQGIVAAHRAGGYHASTVSSWGGGYATSSASYVRTGYAAGYPIVGGIGTGVW
jgi:Spy/CpxP family protein refolding chaperone